MLRAVVTAKKYARRVGVCVLNTKPEDVESL